MIIVTKRVNKHICQGYSVHLLLLVYPMSLSAEFLKLFLIPNHHKGDARMTEGD